jgi:aspartate/methionine/tyrosine aminotransferase
VDPLVRKHLPPGWIDLAVGEAHVVRHAMQVAYGPSLFNLEGVADGCDYQAPEGYMPLVQALEERYGDHVVITSGAKQGLLAVFYALRKLGQTHLAMRSPYWSQMPEAIRLGGLGLHLSNEPTWGTSYLVVSPNNPDGHITSVDEAHELQKKCDKLKTFLVHDAAYHTPVYVDDDRSLAGTTVYSASKMYGLSGLRVGWVVTDDERIAKLASDYVEASTVGVSLLSQQILYNIVEHERLHPSEADTFHIMARELLNKNKRLVQTLSPEVLDTSDMPEHGIFGWFKPGPKFNPELAQVRIPPGSAFGDSTRARINLAIDNSLLSLAVERLNKLV